MSATAVNDRDLCSDSCVVSEWMTHGHDECTGTGTDKVVDVMSVNQAPVIKSGVLQNTRLTVAVTESPVKQEILNTPPFSQTVPSSLDFTSLIVELVHQYAAQVSSCICNLWLDVVLGAQPVINKITFQPKVDTRKMYISLCLYDFFAHVTLNFTG